MFLNKANCARSVINQVDGINASDVSLIVSDASSFPSSPDFLITIWDKVTFPDPCDDSNKEIVKVTNVVGNIFTIVRGQEDTIGASHANGQAVEMLITASMFEEIENAITTALQVPVIGEDLTSQIDGITDTFTITNTYITDTTAVYLNGQRLRRGSGYTELTSTSIKILGDILIVGKKLIIDYFK